MNDKERTALLLWQRLFKDRFNPYIPPDTDGDLYCFFCYSEMSEGHYDDCIYVLARELVND